MTPSRRAIALVASIICASVTSATVIHFADQARDPGVKDWTWYQVLGPSNSPYMILYFSTQDFKTYIGEDLVVLSRARYDTLATYTQARMARPDCPGRVPAGDVWYTVQIAEHAKGNTRQCILPRRSACTYLSGVVELLGINWTAKELQSVRGFMVQIKCETQGPAK
jgi:hypothetical protein